MATGSFKLVADFYGWPPLKSETGFFCSIIMSPKKGAHPKELSFQKSRSQRESEMSRQLNIIKRSLAKANANWK